MSLTNQLKLSDLKSSKLGSKHVWNGYAIIHSPVKDSTNMIHTYSTLICRINMENKVTIYLYVFIFKVQNKYYSFDV